MVWKTSFSSGLEGSAKCHRRVTWLWLVGGCEDQGGCAFGWGKKIFVTNVRWNRISGSRQNGEKRHTGGEEPASWGLKIQYNVVLVVFFGMFLLVGAAIFRDKGTVFSHFPRGNKKLPETHIFLSPENRAKGDFLYGFVWGSGSAYGRNGCF